MIGIEDAPDNHEARRMVSVTDRGTQTEERLDVDAKEKRNRGRKRKSGEDGNLEADPQSLRMDGIDFKRVDQLPSPKRKRLRDEKIKPIEELTFDDIKKYNRNQLRAYCAIYGVKRKRKGEMEIDLAKYAQLFHPNDSNYHLDKFQPTEYSGIPIPRKQSNGAMSPDYSPGPDHSLEIHGMHEQVLGNEQHMVQAMAQSMEQGEHQMHGGEHPMAQMPVGDQQMPVNDHQMSSEAHHHLSHHQEHQMAHHAMNEHHNSGEQHMNAPQHMPATQALPPEHHMSNAAQLPMEQHMGGGSHLAPEQHMQTAHMSNEHHMSAAGHMSHNEQHMGEQDMGEQHLEPIGQQQHMAQQQHVPSEQHVRVEHQLGTQDGQYDEMPPNGAAVNEMGADGAADLGHFQVREVHDQDGHRTNEELNGPPVPEDQENGDAGQQGHHERVLVDGDVVGAAHRVDNS